MIHLITGNTGSGKTTYALKLQKETKSIIFSIDKWNNILFLPDKKPEDGLAWFLERIERAEELMLNLIKQLESSDTDSILDLGLSKFEHRQKFRNFAIANNFKIKLHFLDLPKGIRSERVLNRNMEKGSSFEFEVTKKDFDFMETWYERPTAEEVIGAIIISS